MISYKVFKMDFEFFSAKIRNPLNRTLQVQTQKCKLKNQYASIFLSYHFY